MTEKASILDKFKLFSGNTGGIDSWLSEKTPEDVIVRLANIDSEPLSAAQLSQLLILSHEAGLSPGYFKYYWSHAPSGKDGHPYDTRRLPGFHLDWVGAEKIKSLDHLKWGLYRLYVDALLYFGNVRQAYRELRRKDFQELQKFFKDKCYDTEWMSRRGPPLPRQLIPKDDRYLIAEMACKSYAPIGDQTDLLAALEESYRNAAKEGRKRIRIEQLLSGEIAKKYNDRQAEFSFSAVELLDQYVTSVQDVRDKVGNVVDKFETARNTALKNTTLYLSMVDELDVYVATSMRTRQDFRDMSDACEEIFQDHSLSGLHLRYFDPTLSAANGHEDKGLIECLMVKCAKVLVYTAGKTESYGKDAEAAMALSLGKPVLFYCDETQRSRFFRDIHPLSRLVDFDTGVAVGAIVTSDLRQVTELLRRIFFNDMEYELVMPKESYIQLKETLTDSIVRLQTSDDLLRETFWNYYHPSRS